MLEIHQKTHKQDVTIPDTSTGAKQKQPNGNELPTYGDHLRLNKINQVLHYISTNDITELNEII